MYHEHIKDIGLFSILVNSFSRWPEVIKAMKRKSTTVNHVRRTVIKTTKCHVVYHWEKRNKKSPPMFELTGRQRLTVKRGIRNVGQFLAAEVTNPGQNESQQMIAFCDRMDKDGGIGHIVVRTNRLTGWRKKKEAEWLARTVKTEVAFFSSAKIERKKSV